MCKKKNKLKVLKFLKLLAILFFKFYLSEIMMTGDPTDSIFNFSISANFKPFFNAKEIKTVQRVRVNSTYGQRYC